MITLRQNKMYTSPAEVAAISASIFGSKPIPTNVYPPSTWDDQFEDKTNINRAAITYISDKTEIVEYDGVSGWSTIFSRVSELSGYATNADLSGNLLVVGAPRFRSNTGKIECWYYDNVISGLTAGTNYNGWNKVPFTDDDTYFGTITDEYMGSLVSIISGKVYSMSTGLTRIYEYDIIEKGNLKLKRGAATTKAKIVETNDGVKILGIDTDRKYRVYDPDPAKEGWLGLIYPVEEFEQRNATGNPLIDSYAEDVETRSVYSPIEQVIQLDKYAFGFKNENTGGLGYTKYVDGGWGEVVEALSLYQKPVSGFTESWYNELSAPRVFLSGIPAANFAEIPIDVVNYDFDIGRIYLDLTTLQNYLDPTYDMDCYLSGTPEFVYLNNTRDYARVGANDTVIWLSYQPGTNYISDSTPASENESYVGMTEIAPTTGGAWNYEMIERLKGTYRSGTADLHKSNVYSVEISNSNLNSALTDETQRALVHRIVERAIKEFSDKVAPAHTQLWKIIWKGN